MRLSPTAVALVMTAALAGPSAAAPAGAYAVLAQDTRTIGVVLVSRPEPAKGEMRVQVIFVPPPHTAEASPGLELAYMLQPASFACAARTQRRYEPAFIDVQGVSHAPDQKPEWGDWGQSAPVSQGDNDREIWNLAYRYACGRRPAEPSFTSLDGALAYARKALEPPADTGR